jgi:GT2 family glycosyltransferase
VDRYPYLRKVLEQLCQQTSPPFEVLVVDQTARAAREVSLYEEFENRLALKVIWMDEAGQCRSRNAAMQEASGDYFLLLDDDVEVRLDFIENHLRTIARFRCDASCGVLIEDGAGPLPHDFTYVRASDVFPASNTMVSREALRRSGLFDLAYDRGMRADGDLGIRLHQQGALLVLNPALDVIHHKAARGGLRMHKERVITFASSRHNLLHRHLPSVSEIYFTHRHFQPQQMTEMLWLRTFGTLSARGSRLFRLAKAVVGAAMLPYTIREIANRRREALELSGDNPRIPQLEDVSVTASGTR